MPGLFHHADCYWRECLQLVAGTGLNTANGATVIATPTTTTAYTVTGSSGSCANTAIAVVTVSFPPLLTISASNDSLCFGSAVTLSGSGGSSYTWSPAASLSSTSGSTVTASPTVTTNYSVQTTSAGCPGLASNIIRISVINPISSGTVTANQPACSGACTVVASVSVKGGVGNKYLWSYDNVEIEPNSGLTISGWIGALDRTSKLEDGIQRGISPDLKEAFIVDQDTINKAKLERNMLHPTLTGGKQVKRYLINYDDKCPIFNHHRPT